MYRSLSVTLYGSESQHVQLRLNNTRHFADNYRTIFGKSNLSQDDTTSIRNQTRVMQRNKEWAGEVAIKSAADYLQRTIEVYTSVTNVPPLISYHHPAHCLACYKLLNSSGLYLINLCFTPSPSVQLDELYSSPLRFWTSKVKVFDKSD